MSENFAELFEESLKTVDMEPGSIVTGVVIDIDNEWVTVHAGLKSEGVIPMSQFVDANGECTLSIGDEVQVALETVEDGFGETKLSREKRSVQSLGKILNQLTPVMKWLKVLLTVRSKAALLWTSTQSAPSCLDP